MDMGKYVLYGNPKGGWGGLCVCFVWGMVGRVRSLVVCMETLCALCGVWGVVHCCVSGNSLGFRAVGVLGWIIAHSETLNVHFSGCGCLYGYGETLGAIGRVGTF